jgi:hypothetical protein
MSGVFYFKISYTLNMKQKSIFVLVLGAILVLTVSSTEMAFADYDGYDDGRDSSDGKLEKEKRS